VKFVLGIGHIQQLLDLPPFKKHSGSAQFLVSQMYTAFRSKPAGAWREWEAASASSLYPVFSKIQSKIGTQRGLQQC
jgi:hypothetical protein